MYMSKLPKGPPLPLRVSLDRLIRAKRQECPLHGMSGTFSPSPVAYYLRRLVPRGINFLLEPISVQVIMRRSILCPGLRWGFGKKIGPGVRISDFCWPHPPKIRRGAFPRRGDYGAIRLVG